MRITLSPAMVLAICLTMATSASAQIGKVGINTSIPAAMLHVKDSSVLFTGTTCDMTIPPPVSGAGIRMMWYPSRGAFRAGSVDGNQWNRDNVGLHSFASGFNLTANGDQSFATGNQTAAIGTNSFATGLQTTASGFESFASGSETIASGDDSFATGYGTAATGFSSFSSGILTMASSSGSFAAGVSALSSAPASFATGQSTLANTNNLFAIGRYNDTTAFNMDWSDTDHLFVIGNGSDDNNRNNAVTVLKSGNVGITTTSPKTKLHITGGIDATYADDASGYAVIGPTTGMNMVFDDNEILARNNHASSPLYLQSKGGNLSLCLVSGNVGIGNASPASKFHVTGGSEIVNYSSPGYTVFGPTAGINMVFDANGILARNNGAATMLSLQFLGGDISLCQAGGDVGIGTASPVSRLNIIGGLDAGPSSNGYVQLGATLNSNLVIDNDEILARNNGGAANLSLQRDAGDLLLVELGGRVGIGNNNPASKLHITGGNQLINHASAGYATIGPANGLNIVFDENDILARNNGAASFLSLQSLGGDLGLCAGSGKVVIGTAEPIEKLTVGGNGLFTGTVTASCGVLSCSDIRYKTGIRPIENALEHVKGLHGITYDWDQKQFPEMDFSDRRQIGISAQELEQVYPEMVFTDENGYKTVDYSRLTPVLIEAVKELSAEIDVLKSMIIQMQEQEKR